jgi:hypothetical protein
MHGKAGWVPESELGSERMIPSVPISQIRDLDLRKSVRSVDVSSDQTGFTGLTR